ncbi:MAG: hypothetical protein AB8B66_03640 [Rickettsiaceae bacterium]
MKINGYISSNNYNAAMNDIESLILISPESGKLTKGVVLAAQGKVDAAQKCFKSSANNGNKYARSVLKMGSHGYGNSNTSFSYSLADSFTDYLSRNRYSFSIISLLFSASLVRICKHACNRSID